MTKVGAPTDRRTKCVRGHALHVNWAGQVVAELDRGMWVTTGPPCKVCPKCGAEVEKVNDRS